MKRCLKVTVSVFTLFAMLMIGMHNQSVHVTATTSKVKTCLDNYNSGVAALLDPTHCTTGEEIKLVAAEEEVTYELVMSNVTSTLQVREEPEDDAIVSGKLYRDCGAVVLDRTEGWTKIKSGNLIGWIRNEYLYFGADAEAEALRVGYSVAVVKSDALRVREAADTESAVLGYAANGESLTVVEEVDENWLCVEYGDAIGYILREHVSEEFSVDHGESMDEITERKMKQEAEKRKLVKYYGAMSADEYELLLMAALIYCEAGGESYEGKLAVGAVVCNRIRSSSYADTLQGVIYASGQFSPAMSGKVDRVMAANKIPQSCYDAAKEALGGYTNVGDCLYFRRNNGTREGIVIGNHVFY